MIITRTISNPSPEKLRERDFVTLRRLTHTNTPPVSVRGTVHRWDPIYADWLTLAGWPNQRFAVDGPNAQWTIDRIAREEETRDGVPFTTGSATVTYPGERPQRYRGLYMAGRFYPLSSAGTALPVAPSYSDFVGDPS